MKNAQWKYKLSSNLAGLVLSLLMGAVFGGITLYLYRTENGAFYFGALLSVLMLAVILLAGYRVLFIKLLAGETGFYHQTNPWNGRFYQYHEIKNAWISSGRNVNGVTNSYFNYETLEGRTVRVPLLPSDDDAAAFLIKRIEKSRALSPDARDMRDAQRTYLISGKTFGRSYIAICFVIFLLLLAIDVPYLLYTRELGVPASFLIPASGIAFVAAAFVVLTIRYRCFKVRIDRSGFYVQTNPFNGKYYRYDRIRSCGAIEKVYRHRRSSGGFRRTHYFYFIFTDRDGEQRKFQFQKDIYGHEIAVLQDRIETAGGTVRR